MSTIVFTQTTSTPQQQQQQPSQTRPDTLPIKLPSTTQQPTLISPILTITRTDSIVTNEDHRIPKSPCCHGNESNEHETCSLINESNNVVVICGEATTITTTARSPTVTNSSLLTVTNGSADVCRICHCGPNTLATPTPQLLTPVTSPKKRENNSSKLKPVIINTTTPPNLLLPSSSSNNTQAATPQSPKKQSEDYDLISPCICSGSLKYVHQCCLQHWIRSSNNTACELCKHPYELRSKFKPVWKWEGLPLGGREKKRIVCSAVFHFVALACVVWSLYVLIARTIEELTRSDLEWQFWTKIIVEAIGCLGAGILTYVWGKSYVILLLKWVSYNRSFVILGKKDRKNSSNLECGLNSINKNTTGVQSQSDDLLCDGDNLSVVVRGEGQQQQQQQCLLDDDGQELIQLIK